jgi:hypothetical protein
MNKKTIFLVFLTLKITFLPVKAQFYTISADTAHLSHPSTKVEPPMSIDEKPEQTEKELFTPTRGLRVCIEKDVPVFVSVQDSIMAGLLHDRLNVCLPLDFLKLNSQYGYRKDPIMKCKKFHDGIDLKCCYDYVYSMLPSTVKEVHHGNKGYGNYVILDHGVMECLYGHLSAIVVEEGDIIPAGAVVAISGNTGKSTGPHLHIRLRKDGNSVDPKPFISFLNDYIVRLQDKIAYIRDGIKPQKELNIQNLVAEMDKCGITNQRYVVAQALLETGYFTSRVCLECNNLFGLRRPSDGSYYEFDNWEESVKAYKKYVQYKYKGGDYLLFLKRIGYAEDPDYIIKVHQIAKTL